MTLHKNAKRKYPQVSKGVIFPNWTEYFETVDALGDLPEFMACRQGDLPRLDFAQAAEEEMIERIVNEDYCRYAFFPRIVPNDEAFVKYWLTFLKAERRILSADYDEARYKSVIRTLCNFDPGQRKTYIYPEEAHLTFALSQILAPGTIISIGSFFGFWTMIALVGAKASNSSVKAILVDPDHEVCFAAGCMAKSLGLESNIEILCADFLDSNIVLPSGDLYLIDAETDKAHKNLELRDKAICGPILHKILSAARDGTHVLVHNVLFNDSLDLKSFSPKIRYNQKNMLSFRSQIERMTWGVEVDSCEGLGFYMK